MKLAGRLAALCMTAFASACTVIQTSGLDNARLVGMGVLRLEPSADAELLAVESTGFGVVPSLHGAALGFRKDQLAIVPSGGSCKVVVFRWPEDPETSRRLEALLAEGDICTAKGGE